MTADDELAPGHRGRRPGGRRAGARPACWPSCSRSRSTGSRPRATRWRPATRTRAGGSCWRRIAGGYRYQTHPDLAPYVERFANRDVSHRLSTAALETLAIVAYRQPVSRSQISALRGVNVDGVVRLLEQRGLHRGGRSRRGPRPARPLRHHRPVLGAPRPRPGRAAAPRRGLPAGPRGAGRARGDLPASTDRGAEPLTARGTRPTSADRVEGEEGVRLQKVLARVGIGSRRVCDELIASGKVTVDGATAVARPTRRPRPPADRRSTGVPVAAAPGLVHYLLNKPAGAVTTATDPQGRPTVLSLVPDEPARVPRRSPRPRHRGPVDPHQRRRPGPDC